MLQEIISMLKSKELWKDEIDSGTMKAKFGAGWELETQNLEASMLKFRYHVTTWESRDKNVPKSKKTKEERQEGTST